MTLQEIKSLTAFSAWASNRLLETLVGVPEDEYLRDRKASHGGMHGTLLHMVSAERNWILRLQGQEPAGKLTGADIPSLSALKAKWEEGGFQMAKYIGTLTDKRLQETITVTGPRGDLATYLCWQAIQHIVDHSTYHRGQVVVMLRQAGVVPPNTGLITFYRETARKG